MSDYEYRPFSWEALDVIQVDGDGVATVRGPGTVQWNIPTIEKPVYHLPDDELVTVTVRVPEQFFDFTYPKWDWEEAVKDNQVVYLMDHDLSDMEINDELYGPDGQQMELW